MGAVYENAYITIIAASGNDAEAGLLRLTQYPDVIEVPLVLRLPTHTIELIPCFGSLRSAIDATPWVHRGWTYQERLLSCRSVVFTKEQVFFDCGHMTCSEAFDLVWRPPGSASGDEDPGQDTIVVPSSLGEVGNCMIMGSKPTWRHWESAVASCSKRQFTYPGDRIDAFAGIAKKLVSLSRSRVLRRSAELVLAQCGLPAHGIYESLGWYADWNNNHLHRPYCVDKQHLRNMYNARRSRYILSWTWMGWHGQANLPWFGIKPPFEGSNAYRACALDDYNIRIKPVNDTASWDRWPNNPGSVQPKFPGAVTLHVDEKCIPCHLWCKGHGLVETTFPPSKTVPGKQLWCEFPLAYDLFIEDSKWLEIQRVEESHPNWQETVLYTPDFGTQTATPFDILCFEYLQSGYRNDNGILIRRAEDGLVERASTASYDVPAAWIQDSARSTYLRLF